MTGSDAEGNPVPNFGEYPEDFFDFIIIDECHRGGANDESNWRGILEYFSPAVQLGLTATPLRKHNADTYRYFGEPVYCCRPDQREYFDPPETEYAAAAWALSINSNGCGTASRLSEKRWRFYPYPSPA